MAKRNQVTADLRISASAELKESRSFISQLEKIVDKFDFGDKMNNQLIEAQKQLKDYNKVLEKVQTKSFISDEELKGLVKAGKEIENIVRKTENLYSSFDDSQWKKFSREYIAQVQAQEKEVAKIKEKFAQQTGKIYDKEILRVADLQKQSKALREELQKLTEGGATAIAEKRINEINRKLDIAKKKRDEINNIQTKASNAYSLELDRLARNKGHDNYDSIKNTRIQSEDTIRKALGTEEYKRQQSILNEITKQIKVINASKKDNNNLDKQAIEIAKKYNISNVNDLNDLKAQVKLKKDILSLDRGNKEKYASEQKVTEELNRQKQIVEDIEAIQNGAKKVETKIITDSSPYSSKASLSAAASNTNRTVANLESQLNTTGIEKIMDEATQEFNSRQSQLTQELGKTNSLLNSINSSSEGIEQATGKSATQSERLADESDIKEMQSNTSEKFKQTETDINNHTDGDNSRIAAQIVQEFNRNKIENLKNKMDEGLSSLTKEDFSDEEIKDANKRLLENNINLIFQQLDDAISGKNNQAELKANIKSIINLSEEMGDVFNEELKERRRITADNLKAYNEQLKTRTSPIKKEYLEKSIEQEKIDSADDEKKLSKAISASYNLTDIFTTMDNLFNRSNLNIGKNAEAFSSLNKNIQKSAEESKYLGTVWDDLGNKISYFLSINYLFDTVVRKVREASTFTKELDKDMVQIGLVLGQTAGQTWKNFDNYAQMADRLNTTVSDVTGAMKLFYQQGLNTVEVNKMVEASAIAAALGESSMAEASETLTSIINSYNLTASQAIAVTDKISMVAMVSAADFGELSTAIEKVASSAASAGLDLDHMMGYLAKMIETTREAPTNIGTALKTIVANFTQFKEDPSGLSEEGSDINKVDTALKSVGIALTDAQGEVRDLGEIIDELGKKWNSLNRSQKAYLATQIAGTRQQSRFYALMNDYGRTLELVEEASNSDGKATEQFALYQDSLTAATAKLNNEWEKFYNRVLKNDVVLKGLQNTASGLLKTANELGPTLSMLVTAGLLKGVRSLFVHFSNLKDKINETNKAILSSTNLMNAAMNGNSNIFAGYSFNKKTEGDNKVIGKQSNNLGSSIANAVFNKKGGQEQLQQLEQMKKAMNELNDSNMTFINNNKELIKTLVGQEEAEKVLNGTISTTARERAASTVAAQAETVAHTASTSVKWAEVAAQLALNLAIGAAVGAIGLVVYAYNKWKNAANETAKASAEIAKKVKEEYQSLDSLIKDYLKINNIVNKTEQQKEQLSDVTQSIIDQFPELIDGINSEGKAYLKADEELKQYLLDKQKLSADAAAQASRDALKAKDKKTTAYTDKSVFGGASKNDNFIGPNTESNAKNIQGGVDSLRNIGMTAIANQIEEYLADGRDTAATSILDYYINDASRVKDNQHQSASQRAKARERYETMTGLRSQINARKDSVMQDMISHAANQYNPKIIEKQQSKEFNTQQANIAKSLLNDYYKEQFKDKESGEQAREALEKGELDAGVNEILDKVGELSRDEIDNYNEFLEKYHNKELSANELGNELKGFSDSIQHYGQKYIEETTEEIEKMVPKLPDFGTAGGNIDLNNRPIYKQPNGSISTVNSISFKDNDGLETLIPTIIKDQYGNAQQLTEEEAIEHYRKTGEYLGKFQTALEANTYALELHKKQEELYAGGINHSDEIQKRRQENARNIKASTRKMLIDAYDEMQSETGEGFNKDEINAIYGKIFDKENELFLNELDNLDTTNLGEVNKFKEKYAGYLGAYGEKLIKKLTQNAEYDAEKVQSKISTAQAGMTTANKNGIGFDDISTGTTSQSDALNELTNESENARRNITSVGNELVVTGKEITDSFLESQQEAFSALETISSQAEKNIEKYQNRLNELDGKGIDKLTNKEKKEYNQLQKNILAEKNRIKTSKNLAKAYKEVSITQQAINDNQHVITGFAEISKEISSLRDLADMYQYVGDARMSQLDIIDAVANNLELLLALEVNEQGNFELTRQGIEKVAVARIEQVESGIRAQIEEIDMMISMVDVNQEYTQDAVQKLAQEAQARLDGAKDAGTATENSGKAMQQNLTNTKSWASGVAGFISKSVNAWKAFWKASDGDKNVTVDQNVGGVKPLVTSVTDGMNENTTIKGADLKNKLEEEKRKLQISLETLDKYKKSPSELMKDINSMGDYKSSGGSGGSGKGDDFKPVEEKLEHFYNYLRKIEALEAKINKIHEKRNLIDATNNYYIDDLIQENKLLQEQSKLYDNYINDEKSYLKTLQGQLSKKYSEWVRFDNEGVVQVKQTEFKITSEKEQKKYDAFAELLEEYQKEYNTMLENQNKLYQIQAQVIENINAAYDKQLKRLDEVTERLEYINSISEHKINMNFGTIGNFKLITDQMETTSDMILNAQKNVTGLEVDFKNLKKTVEKSDFKSLLTWDNTLQQYTVNDKKMEDKNTQKKFEKMGYNWADVETYVRAIAGKSQKIRENITASNEKLMSSREALKSLVEDFISNIDTMFDKFTEEINKVYDIWDRKNNQLTINNDLFGVDSKNLESQMGNLMKAVTYSKTVLKGLQANNKTILKTINSEYSDYVKMIDGAPVINKVAIEESTKLSEAQKAELLSLYQLYYDQKAQIEEVNDKFYDYMSQIQQLEETKRDAIIDLENQVHDELMARYQKEINDLSKKYQKMNQLDSEYYSKLQQRISDARDARSREQGQQDLTQMQNRLSVLQQDNSGQYNAELVDLQRQINEGLQNQADQNIDLEMERISREQQQRQEDREMQIAQMENLLTFKDENGIYWQEARTLIELGQATIEGFLTSSQEFQNSTGAQQASNIENIRNTIQTAKADYSKWLKEDSAYEAGEIGKKMEEIVTASLSDNKTAISTAATNITTVLNTGISKVLVDLSTICKYLDPKKGKDDAGGTKGTGTKDGLVAPKKNEPKKDNNNSNKNNKDNKDKTIRVGSKVKLPSSARIYEGPTGNAGGTQYYGNDPIYTVLEVKGNRIKVRYHKLKSGTTGWFDKSKAKAYSQGGYVDYTGIAAVHGKTGKPEAFLNARQTALFETLRDSLAKVSTIKTKEEKQEDNSLTIENFTIDVKELADVDSIDKVVKTVKDSIYRDATSGNNMKINRRR